MPTFSYYSIAFLHFLKEIRVMRCNDGKYDYGLRLLRAAIPYVYEYNYT